MPTARQFAQQYILSLLVLGECFFGCTPHAVEPQPGPLPDSISNPPMNQAFSLCYMSSSSGHWNVLVTGSNPVNISAASNLPSSQDDEYPAWSPDGTRIMFERTGPVGGPSVHVFSPSTSGDTVITSDGGVTQSPPQWIPNGKISCSYESPLGDSPCTYLIDANGANKRQILDFAASVSFYQNCYDFVYAQGSRWYRTNLDGPPVLIFLDSLASGQYITVRDFNAATGDLLTNTNTIPGTTSAIATFNADTKAIVPLLTTADVFSFALQRYSPDHSKVVFVEQNVTDQYLSILEGGTKRRLVHIQPSSPPVYFTSDPMQFSPDGRYVTFSEAVFNSGQWVSFSLHLYVVDTYTRGLQQIGDGTYASWKPNK